MFVIMKSVGEYDDRTETPVFVTYTKESAQDIIKELKKASIREISEQKYRADLFAIGIDLNAAENPEPVYHIQRPVFDQTRARDKEYVKEHTARKRAAEDAYRDWFRNVYTPWWEAQSIAGKAYENANFDPTLITKDSYKPQEYELPGFYYEEVLVVS